MTAFFALLLPLLAQEDQVFDLRARHEAGQTILTWKEVSPSVKAESITINDLRKARQKHEKSKDRYRVYRSKSPITSLKGLEPIAEASPLTCWNDEYYGISPEGGAPALRYVVEEGKGPVPPGTGIYAHNPSEAGEAYYAVTVVGGSENITVNEGNALKTPVKETVGPGPFILQRTEKPEQDTYLPHPTLYYYVRWEAPPRCNVPSRPYDYRVGIPSDLRKPAPLDLALHCWGANLDSGFLWWYKGNDGGIIASTNQIPYDWWITYHEKYGIAKNLKEGMTRDYTPRRLFAFLDWVATKWEVDKTRVIVSGASMGGSGAGMIAVRHPERFAYALSSVGVHNAGQSPQFKGSYEGACGRVKDNVPHESGLKTFDYLSNSFLLRQDPKRDLPFISFANGKNDAGIGWAQALDFARALQETRQPHLFTWGQNGHGERVYVPTPTGGGDGGPDLKPYLDIRLGQSLPAFTKCSLDSNPGSGDPNDGDPAGQFNLHLRWDTNDIADEEKRYEITIYLIDEAPKDECTADLTPRRSRKFKPSPDQAFSWTNVSGGKEVQSGAVKADSQGLVTLEKVKVTKGRNRITIAEKQRP